MARQSKKREAKILEEIRKRVFERETQLSDQARQAMDAEINLQVLEEMTESLTSTDIANINDQVRSEFAEQEAWRRRMLFLFLLLIFAAALFWFWPRNRPPETAQNVSPPVENPVVATRELPDEPARIPPTRKPADKPEGITEMPRNPELVEAVSLGLMETVKFLINNGASPATQTEKENMPVLNLAIEKRHEDIAGFLVVNGAPIQSADARGQTALHRAAWWGMTELIGLLLKNGAVVDAPDKKGLTPAMIAAFQGQDEALKLLAGKGARLDMKDSRVTPAFLVASRKLYLRGEHRNQRQALLNPAIDLLSEQSDHGMRALMDAAYAGDLQTVKILLDLGIKVNVTDRFGSTALISAAYGGKTHVARLLVEKGAYVNVRGKYGFTPLIAAVEGGCYPEFVKFLLTNKADVTVKSETGNDVFVYMRGRCNKEMKQLFERLKR